MPSRRKPPRSPRSPPAPRNAAVEHALFSFEGGQAATTDLLAHGATALICGSDILALGAIRAARRTGLTVPGDISVVGFDDSAFMDYRTHPSPRSGSRSSRWARRRSRCW